MGAIRRPDGGGSVASRERERGNKARVLVSLFQRSSLLQKGKPLLHHRQKGAKAIPKVRQPARSARWIAWDYRPFAVGVAAAHGML